MKSNKKIALAVLVIAAALIIVFWKDPSAGAGDKTETAQNRPTAQRTEAHTPEQDPPTQNTDDIPLKDLPKELPAFRKSNRDDPAATEKLINIISRHPSETGRLIEENQWIKRREIVEQEESFGEIAGRIFKGEKVKEFEIPLFDGETATFEVDYNQTAIISESSGTIHGQIKGESESQAILSFYRDADAGFVNFPDRGLTIEYDSWGQNRLIVKDYDGNEKDKALPCSSCKEAGTAANHGQHGPLTR